MQRRQAAQVLQDVVDPATGKTAVQKLFEEVAPKYADKNGGYTRVLKKLIIVKVIMHQWLLLDYYNNA